MSISAKELAAKLGVSAATISMVMNNKPGISEATRQKILAAADEYGFTFKKNHEIQNGSVIHLITYKKHSKVLTDTPFFSQLIESVTRECLNENCKLHISYVHEDGNMAQQIEQIRSVECSGILLLATEMLHEDFSWFSNINTPIVVLDAYYESLDLDCIVINNIQGAYKACTHLIRRGYTKIGHIASSVGIANFKERREGYKKALGVNQLELNPDYEIFVSPSSSEGYLDMCNIIKSGKPLAQAYFADNDIIAASAVRAFRENGIRIPEDVSIIGFDNMPFCDMMFPTLSSMNVNKDSFGRIAVQRLLQKIRTGSSEDDILKVGLNTSLIERESVSTL